MTKTNTSLSRRFITIAGSSKFFWAIVALLVLQAAWIALSGRYPMAFDEDFHLGIIRLYAHHLGPFWSSQPANADKFGAVARDPSYLYHFLMSFPYRLISAFTSDQTIQVLILRAINIGLFVSGLVLYRRLMLKTGVSKSLVHACLLLFVLIPIVPLLAAQINYDNLFLPVTAVTLLLVVRFNEALTQKKRLDTKTILQLLTVCLLASLVKYAFLPIFVAIIGFVVVRVWQYRRSMAKLRRSLVASWRALSGWLRLGLAISLILAGGLFVERYGVNIVRYHEPVPDCSKVLNVKQCRAYGAWVRDYDYEIANVQGGQRSPMSFTREWFYGMWLRTLFAVGGPDTDFETRGPLLVPGVSMVVLAAVSVLAVLATAPRLLKRYNAPVLWLFAAVTISYIGILWLDEYKAFLHTGHPVAINGRYLLPLALPTLLIGIAGVNELIKNRRVKPVLASLAVLSLMWGGGALTFILRSNDTWYWANNSIVKSANHAVQNTLGPITPGYYFQTQFLRTGL